MNQDLEDLLAGRPGTPSQPTPYVFVGVVRELGAAAMPGVPVTDNTARVTVEEVLRSSGTLDDYTGRDITVQLSSPAEVGQRLIFFTRGWLYGQSVAVVEVARADVSERDVSDLRERIADLFFFAERFIETAVVDRATLTVNEVFGEGNSMGPLNPEMKKLAVKRSPPPNRRRRLARISTSITVATLGANHIASTRIRPATPASHRMKSAGVGASGDAAGSEHQYRHIQWQRQQGDKDTGAAHADGQRTGVVEHSHGRLVRQARREGQQLRREELRGLPGLPDPARARRTTTPPAGRRA